METLKRAYYAVRAFCYQDGVSSLLHSLAVLLPALALGEYVHPHLGAVWGNAMCGWYLNREQGDFKRARQAGDEIKMRDALRDFGFPLLAAIIVNSRYLF